jgi:predicted nucleic acid-binding protein
MKVLIDTNVIIDVLTKRPPHVERSAAFMRLLGPGLVGHVSASQITDIYYILNRSKKDTEASREIVRQLAENLTVIDVYSKDIHAAFDSPVEDFEDALIAQCAKRMRADYIITRNGSHFVNSPVMVYSPDDFINKYFSDRA